MNIGRVVGQWLGVFGLSLDARWPKFRVRRQKLRRKLFIDNKLRENTSKGYWMLKEMPSESDLAEYYASEYWLHRGDQGVPLIERDLNHYFMLRGLNPKLFTRKPEQSSFLNFGSGHGGLSNIMHGLGFMIVNVDPSVLPYSRSSRWESFSTLEQVCQDLPNVKFDLIYSSHALEHVTNIEHIFAKFKDISKDETTFFFEVPDGTCPGEGGSDGTIRPPHTYYFSPEFFTSSFLKTIMLRSFDDFDSREPREIDWVLKGEQPPLTKGNTIQFLGQGLKTTFSVADES
jgi:2-polyprenyl-3-methyl-5-hydroxy-6-metoxy-1,4-benzoquinol methylase